LIPALAGCGSEDKKKSCPAGGIGVAAKDGTPCIKATVDPSSAAGKDCLEQFNDYKGYDCFEPQICVDQGKRKVPDFVLDAMSSGQEVSFLITNCSSGNRKLTLSKLTIAGDSRCSLAEPQVEPGKVIEAGQQAVVRTIYKPKGLGEDHAALIIQSDAQNFKPLIIPICGKALPRYAPGKDSGPPPTGDAGSGPLFDCKDVGTTVNKTCHQE
jgi:hypothetical protein